MDQKPLKIKLSVSLDEDVVEKLRPLAQEDDRTLSSYINLVLRKHLRNLEKT
ncbi:MAG: toxin-antitoxin system protein [Oscillibacter sp.]|nr:toxin-antitoxin system protein [Oscillibacter sp.]